MWKIVGTGDFNGDGKSDILWQDTSGNVAIWFMNGAQVKGAAGVGSVPPSVWTIVGTGISTATARRTFCGMTAVATSQSG